MFLRSLSPVNFRNLAEVRLECSTGVNIFYGDNGSGKTNLLETIFVLCLGRSHRGAADVVMLAQGADTYRVEGKIQSDEELLLLAVAYQKGGRRKITLDKLPIRVTELYERFCAVAAGPEDSVIISGGPSCRREFIDIYLSQFSKKYLATLSTYTKILSQKNAALKNEMNPAPFEDLLIDAGAEIMRERINFISYLKAQAARAYQSISGGGALDLVYKPSVTLESEAAGMVEIKESFRRIIERSAERERSARITLVGPHRDDIHFEINHYPARTHASQGEWRTAAIALKTAVYHLIKERRQTAPLLLFDEIFAELDNKRTEALINLFADFKQLFLTTAVEPPEALKVNSRSFKVSNGRIVDVN